MNTKIKTIISILLFVVFLVVAYTAYSTLSDKYNTAEPESSSEDESSSEPESTSEDESSLEDKNSDLTMAPDFTVYDSNGNEIKLSDFIGKPIVLNFWASWCPPCKSEMPHFNEAYNELAEEKDVIFMMVDLADGVRETQADGQNYVDDQGYDFPVYFDNDQEAAYAYAISSIPTTLFINSEGYIVYEKIGTIDKRLLIDKIASITK